MNKNKNKLICMGLLFVTSLFSCSGGGNNVYYLDGDGEVAILEKIKIYFPKKNEVPYISLEDGVTIASAYRSASYDNESYKYTYEAGDNSVTVKDERGTKATFDITNQTITIDDFDTFIIGYSNGFVPLATTNIAPGTKSIKLVTGECEYVKGSAMTINLKNYSSIDLIKDGKNTLIPIATYNSIFFGGQPGSSGFTYNFNDAYLALTGLKSLESVELNELGKKYFKDAPKKDTVSSAFAQYTYDAFMLDFDYFYGLKKYKNISSFAAFSEEKGLKADLLSGDLAKMEKAYCTLIYKCLEDGHAGYLTPTPLVDYNGFAVDDSCFSEKTLIKEKEQETMNKMRATLKITKPFEVIGDTAFIYFDYFMDLSDTILYSGKLEQYIDKNNAALFAYAYQQIKANPSVKNVVVDLVTNNGGDATGLVYCLATLIGKHYFDAENPLNGSRSHYTYVADLNLDGVIDDKDVPLINDYNIYMLDSKFAFSCGNLFPVAAKYNNSNVTILGDVTGGGTCVVSNGYSGLGAGYIKSGSIMLTKKVGNEYKDIEDGVQPDYPVDYDKMYDRNYIVSLVDSIR